MVYVCLIDLARIIGSEKVSDGFLSGREPP
eukprot:SAG11_NODE_45605_length_143_cov_21.045455_1_plen_29_part_01